MYIRSMVSLPFSAKICVGNQILTYFPVEFLKNFNGYTKLFQTTFNSGGQNPRYRPKKGSFQGSKLKKTFSVKNFRQEPNFDLLPDGIFEKFQRI